MCVSVYVSVYVCTCALCVHVCVRENVHVVFALCIFSFVCMCMRAYTTHRNVSAPVPGYVWHQVLWKSAPQPQFWECQCHLRGTRQGRRWTPLPGVVNLRACQLLNFGFLVFFQNSLTDVTCGSPLLSLHQTWCDCCDYGGCSHL